MSFDDAGTYDATDPKAEEALRREAGRREAADRRVIADLMAGQEGRDWVYRKFEFGGSADPFDTNPYVCYYNLGNERLLAALRKEITDLVPDLYVKMMNEQKIKAQAREDKRRRDFEAANESA